MIKIKNLGEFTECARKIDRLSQGIKSIGRRWSERSVQVLDHHIRHNLAIQGRSNAAPPPLSGATRKIYAQRGEPDGSGIRDHIRIDYESTRNGCTAILGIAPSGATVARVQERGAYIKVTPKMRGYLATLGIFLRADTHYIKIPARRFWSKSNRSAKEESIKLLHDLFSQLWQLNS